MDTIRLMLVDDHDIVRTGLKAFLNTQEGLQVVGEANSGESALQTISAIHPDVVIMDITMPQMDGLEATRRMKMQYPDIKVLALTVHADKQYFFEMLSSGAVGYVTKDAAAEELVAAIWAVAQGNVYLQPALALWLLEDYRRLQSQADPGGTQQAPGGMTASGLNAEVATVGQTTARRKKRKQTTSSEQGLEVLSERERQVLEFVAEGMTNIQIGERLSISPKTVARHRERIMNKLNLHSCTELVKFAIRTGLIELQ